MLDIQGFVVVGLEAWCCVSFETDESMGSRVRESVCTYVRWTRLFASPAA